MLQQTAAKVCLLMLVIARYLLAFASPCLWSRFTSRLLGAPDKSSTGWISCLQREEPVLHQAGPPNCHVPCIRFLYVLVVLFASPTHHEGSSYVAAGTSAAASWPGARRRRYRRS